MNKSIYTKSFDCDNSEDFQKHLNVMHEYKGATTMYLHRLRINLFYDLISDLIKNKTIKSFNSAIDIGCNAGTYSKLLSDIGFKYVKGIDIDDKLLARAEKHYAFENKDSKLKFEFLNAENINNNEKYDFILCTEVIEHTQHPEKVIQNIKQILGPEGIAIITLPNAISLPYLLTYLSYKIKGKPIDGELKDHLSYPFFKSIRLFNESPIRIIKTTGTNLFFWHFLYKYPLFPFLNRINFYLSKFSPFKYFTQFFFIVLEKGKEDSI